MLSFWHLNVRVHYRFYEKAKFILIMLHAISGCDTKERLVAHPVGSRDRSCWLVVRMRDYLGFVTPFEEITPQNAAMYT